MSERLVLVTVGSDHHPFERLVRWADAYAASHPETRVRVQYGTAAPPTHAEGSAYLEHAELTRLMGEADAVVTQGGPSGIAECRAHGRLPVCVPRRHELGEHVDDHQYRFACFLGTQGEVALVDSLEERDFVAAVDDALSGDDRYRVDASQDAAENAQAVRRFAEIVDALPRPRQGRRYRVARRA